MLEGFSISGGWKHFFPTTELRICFKKKIFFISAQQNYFCHLSNEDYKGPHIMIILHSIIIENIYQFQCICRFSCRLQGGGD